MKKKIVIISLFSTLAYLNPVYSQNIDSQLKTVAGETIVTCSEVNFGNNAPKKNANSITLIWSDSKKNVRIITDDRLFSSLGAGTSTIDKVERRLYRGRDVDIDSSEISFFTNADANWKEILWRLDRSSALLKAYNPNLRAQVYNTYRCVKGSSKL
jgi:hypothetical protein